MSPCITKSFGVTIITSDGEKNMCGSGITGMELFASLLSTLYFESWSATYIAFINEAGISFGTKHSAIIFLFEPSCSLQYSLFVFFSIFDMITLFGAKISDCEWAAFPVVT